MNQPLQQDGPALRQDEYPDQDILPQHLHTHSPTGDAYGNYFEATAGTHQCSHSLHMHNESYNQHLGSANSFTQYHTGSYGINAGSKNLQDPRASGTSSRFATGNDQSLIRGIGNYATRSSPGTQNHENVRGDGAFLRGALSCMAPRRSVSVASGSPALIPMPPLTQLSIEHSTPPSEQVRQTKYEPFQDLFCTSDEAKDHRRRGTRFSRTPYTDPVSDYSIVDIEHNRSRHVLRIYNAMTSGENAKDNRGSIAMKRWVLEAHYPPDLVEAYAHKVFDCLIAQAKEGFRGWVHNDYVADERKGDDIDKDIDCAGRLDNVILALEQEKTICEDVMNSACQIRMFVNAPRAYANRKHQNRVGNSKRGRTKDTLDSNLTPSKAQRTGGRHTRARSSTISDMPSSRGTTPQHQQLSHRRQPLPPYYSHSKSQKLTPDPFTPNYAAPRSTPLPRSHVSASRNPFAQHLPTTMPQPTPSPQTSHVPQSHTPCMVTTAPPHQQSPFMSPPPLSHDHYSAPATPDDARPSETEVVSNNWQNTGDLCEPSWSACQQDKPILDPMLSHWGFTNRTVAEVAGNANVSDAQPNGFVNLSGIEYGPDNGAESSNQGPFGDFWSMQHDV